jgi:hypothetical protein
LSDVTVSQMPTTADWMLQRGEWFPQVLSDMTQRKQRPNRARVACIACDF